MRTAMIVLAVLALAAPVGYAQTAIEGGFSINALTAELIPVVKARLGNVLAQYLVQHNPNLALSLNVAQFALTDEAEAHVSAVGGFEVFLGGDNLPNGGKGQLGLGFDVYVKPIKSRLEAQVLFGLGTDGLSFKPTIAATIDVGAIIGLVQDAIDSAVRQ
ncbi:MAG: hypothetical protein QW793_06280 [Candidatus Caldarchaeum sp.]